MGTAKIFSEKLKGEDWTIAEVLGEQMYKEGDIFLGGLGQMSFNVF